MSCKTVESHSDNRKDASQLNNIRLCKGCGLHVAVQPLIGRQVAYCPRCNTKMYRGASKRQLLSGNLSLALTCLLLFIPSHFFPFLTIRLFGEMISGTLPYGVLTLFKEGYPEIGALILFCTSVAPLILCLSVLTAHWALRFRKFKTFRLSLKTFHLLKPWMMLDVFLASIAISCFKLKDYADLFFDVGLVGVILLQLFILMLIRRVNIRDYWEAWQKESRYHFITKEIQCSTCNLSQPLAKEKKDRRCCRCNSYLKRRKTNSLQQSAAFLLAAAAFIIPANIIPISIFFTNGERIEDTILSGISTLITKDMQAIAVIIFIASIVVPITKIAGLSYILINVHFRTRLFKRQKMAIYYGIKWIGKWSMMDLMVISIMMTLVDRGQILNFTPGVGAIAFAIVVVFTMIATELFDPRLIWYDEKIKSDT